MNEVTCNTIRDLLPLCVDGVASDDTQSMVAKHLEHCPLCRKEYDDMRLAVAVPIENDARPLRQFKCAWKKKKAALVCGTALLTVILLCCAFFAYQRLAYQDKIAAGGAVYVQRGVSVTQLPSGCTQLGILKSIVHQTAADPTEDFTAVNLDEKYAGCPVYLSTDAQTLYLEDYGGFYIPFALEKAIAQPEEGA